MAMEAELKTSNQENKIGMKILQFDKANDICEKCSIGERREKNLACVTIMCITTIRIKASKLGKIKPTFWHWSREKK